MKKQFVVALAVLTVPFLLGAIPAAAQGRGQSTSRGAAASAGAHEPMGMGSSMNGRGGMENSNAPKAPSGPKSPDQLLAQNTKLSSNLQSLLPAGTDLQTAAQGFKNLGQFVAAVHVSHNLGITFACMKADMTDTAPPSTVTCPAGTGTGSKPLSLGASIEALKPDITKSQVKSATKTARHQANADLRQS
ncbi:MAG: hypothetical protein KGL02_01935 [Acidobacteriota bacterium]|nr:hypothetical protein [Acidobacteriota bacterium]MDE3169328.1 hypothetical protein [Acidobacteriota bacterium]